MRQLRRVLAPLLFLLLIPLYVSAGETVYLRPGQIDFSMLLPPPPSLDSPQQKEEMAVLLQYQKDRTPEQEAFAQADSERSVFRFADVVGPQFTPEKLPLTAALFEAVRKSGSAMVDPAKDFFGRPRPYTTNPDIHPCVHKPSNISYPSGHATFGTETAIILAAMLPEKRAAIFERAAKYRQNRVIGGAHYPSDIAAGNIAGTVVAAFLLQDQAFQDAFAKAKAETRAALGLPNP